MQISSNQPDLLVLQRLTAAERFCLIVAVVVAALELLLWLVPPMMALLPVGWAHMRPNTSVAVLLAAASIFLSRSGSAWWQVRISRVLAGLLLLLSLITLFEYAIAISFGFDSVLLNHVSESPALRMSWQTACGLLMLSVILFWMRSRKDFRSQLVDAITLLLAAYVLLLVSGYIFNASRILGREIDIRTPPQTLICLLLLIFVAVARRTEYGVLSVLTGVGIGSRIARITLPFAVLLPFLFAVARDLVTFNGILPVAYATALTTSVTSFLVFCFVLLTAIYVNRLERELRELSLKDQLTQVYNQRGFALLGEQALRIARRSGTGLAVLYVDLDGLKAVNDQFGHEAGSEFISTVAGILKQTFRDSDTVARVGGDEFVVIAGMRAAELEQALSRLEATVSEFNATATRPYRIEFSLGYAIYDPAADETLDTLVGRADAMMYRQKRDRKLAVGEKTEPGSVRD